MIDVGARDRGALALSVTNTTTLPDEADYIALARKGRGAPHMAGCPAGGTVVAKAGSSFVASRVVQIRCSQRRDIYRCAESPASSVSAIAPVPPRLRRRAGPTEASHTSDWVSARCLTQGLPRCNDQASQSGKARSASVHPAPSSQLQILARHETNSARPRHCPLWNELVGQDESSAKFASTPTNH
jgi:hypothetical protein